MIGGKLNDACHSYREYRLKNKHKLVWKVLFGLVWFLCYINHCRLYNAESSLYIYIRYICVTWYPTGRREKNYYSSCLYWQYLAVKERPLRNNVGHRGDINRCWYLVTSGRQTSRGRREKPNDWLGPQNGSGDSFPSAEVNSKKVCFFSRARGRQTH